MIFTIVDNLDVYVSQASTDDIAAINKHFELRLADCGKRYFGHMGVSPVLNFFDFRKGRINLHLLPDLMTFCDNPLRKRPYQIIDNREPWPHRCLTPEEIGPDFLAGITLEQFQLRCIHAICNNDFGVIDAVTGAGKTEVMAATCKANPGVKTVILSEQRVVIEQIKERLELRDIEDVGLFYHGQTPDGQSIVIASVQSSTKVHKTKKPMPIRNNYKSDDEYAKALVKYESMMKGFRSRNMKADVLRDIIKDADMLLVDEADLATSQMYRHIFRMFFKGRKRYGFTGSVFDSDKKVESMKMRSYLGPVIAVVPREEVLAAGRINDVTYTMLVLAGHRSEIHDNSTLNIAIDEKLTANAKFHAMIKMLCKKHEREKILILLENKALGRAIEANIPNSVFICGDTSKKQRNLAVKKLQSGEISVLIGGKILKRGFDLKGGADVVILAAGGKLESDMKQKIGRGYRRSPLGYTRIYDFMFRVNKYLYDHSRARLKTMIRLRIKTKVIYPNGFVIDGADLVKRNFNVGKNWQQAT